MLYEHPAFCQDWHLGDDFAKLVKDLPLGELWCLRRDEIKDIQYVRFERLITARASKNETETCARGFYKMEWKHVPFFRVYF